METRTDLNTARAAWLDELNAHAIFSQGQLRELEAHLDDAMDNLILRGLSPGEAFLISTRRLGQAQPLASEFRKGKMHGAWGIRTKWMLLGMVAYLATTAITQIMTDLSLAATTLVAAGPVREFSVPICYMAASLFGLWLLHRCVTREWAWRPAWVRRSPMLAMGGLLLAVFAMPMPTRLFSTNLAVRMLGFPEFEKEIMTWMWFQLGGSMLWLGTVAFLLRRNWQTAPESGCPE